MWSTSTRTCSALLFHRSPFLNVTYCRTISSTMPILSETTSSHYKAHTAESYEQAYFYEPGAYQRYLVQLVQQRLRLDSSSTTFGRHILDIGGGTGNFAHALLVQQRDTTTGTHHSQQLQHHITVVDPFLDATQQSTTTSTSTSTQISFVKESAEVFWNRNIGEQSWRNNFHQVLLKEVVHHLNDRVKIFRGMYEDLKRIDDAVPSILIITRPQVDIDYPLWDSAREVWKKNQPSSEELCHELQEAGFHHIQQSLESYPCQISLQRWKAMIQQRFWSTFSNFTDEELQIACDKIEEEHADRVDDKGILHFEDRLVLISASKI